MDLDLEGKSVIVTGGGSNIGRAICLAFAQEGCHVTIADIDDAAGRRTATEAVKQGAASVTVVKTDVVDRRPPLRREDPRGVGARVQLNLWGTINCTRAVLDGMVAQKSGAVVSMGSDAGRTGEFREGVYAACKAGVVALSKSLAREHGRQGIRFNVVWPEMTVPESAEDIGASSMWTQDRNRALRSSEMQARVARAYPLGRVGHPTDVAPAVVFLASSAARFITGQTLSVSGGYTML